ncbi:hypothetical protein BC835DRAFT_653701 [Cytidiella melzeri]|nr:hypothetical protein BC835DRAFT_653701 [Cytidiella melzeri]
MARRSQRIKQLHERNPTQASSLPKAGIKATPDKTDFESDVEVRPTKRVQTTRAVRASRVTRRLGKLRGMLDMPLDVILEICSHLHPKDLLNLARTTKDLRKFFMGRNSLTFWKAAQLNIPDLPPCPTDLTEPAYANLMFDAHCHNCGGNKCHHIYWRYRVRLCKRCRQGSTAKATAYVITELEELIAPREIGDVIPPFEDRSHTIYCQYYQPEIDRLLEAVKQMPPTELDSYLEAQEKLALLRKEDEIDLDDWIRSTKVSQNKELERLREARQSGIIAKLQEEGSWQEDISYMVKSAGQLDYYRFQKLPEVHKTQALTPKIWNKIREPIITFMQSVRENRLTEDHRERLTRRLHIMRELVERIVPRNHKSSLSCREIALYIPEVWRMLDRTAAEFDTEEFQRVLQVSIPEYLEKRTQDTRKFFEDTIKKELGIDGSADPWKLAATAWFNCDCLLAMPFEHVLHHMCGAICSPPLRRPEGMSIDCFKSILNIFWNRVWDVDRFRATFERMKLVIEACGMDVKTATVEDMDRPDIRLACSHSHFTTIMTWRTAVYGQRCGGLELATPEQTFAAKTLEPVAEELHKKELQLKPTFRCTHCSTVSGVNRPALKTHLKDSHAIEDPKEDDWLDERMTLSAPQPICLVTDKAEDNWSWLSERYFQDGVAMYFGCE